MAQSPQVDLFAPDFKANLYLTYAQLRSTPRSTACHYRTDGACGW